MTEYVAVDPDRNAGKRMMFCPECGVVYFVAPVIEISASGLPVKTMPAKCNSVEHDGDISPELLVVPEVRT